MPLIDITMKPGYRMRLKKTRGVVSATPNVTRIMIKQHFSQALPELLVANVAKLGLDLDTPSEGIQVMNHNYGDYDVNVANVWIKFQFSEPQPELGERLRIRNQLYALIMGWFEFKELIPEDFIMDILWGPTNGKGVIDGVEILW
ncbi:MAG: hypothetical protein WA030_03170 [Candidatus Microsaccharimonas sp.]